MLDPGYLENLPDNLVRLYAQAEQDILTDMARRISTYDYYIPAAEHQRRVLSEMGMVRENVIGALSEQTGRTQKELARLMEEAGAGTYAADAAVYEANGLHPLPLAASAEARAILRAGLAQTNGLFENLTRTTASTAGRQFENALDRAWMQVSSGAFDYNTAIRNAVKDLSRQGVGAVTYPSGHVDTLETAVRRAVVTGVNQTALRMRWELADELGSDLVETTAHAGARPSHAQWQGQIFSRSGKSSKYANFKEATDYGTGAGLGGWNCRHSFFPYFEGSPRTYTDEMLREYEAKNYTYNGKALTEYEAMQRQREIERNIRRWKREQAAMKAAGQDASEAAAKVRQWQAEQRSFLQQTGLKRQGAREQVANAARSGILKDTGIKLIPVTGDAIRNLPVVTGGILNGAAAVQLQERHRELLRMVMGKPVGTEAALYCGMDGKLIEQYVGGQHQVASKVFSTPYIATHNHPDCLIFSHKDIDAFIKSGDMRMLTAVGNNGAVYALSKTDQYNAAGFIQHYLKTTEQCPDHMSSPERYISWIEKIVRGGSPYGVVFEQRGPGKI